MFEVTANFNGFIDVHKNKCKVNHLGAIQKSWQNKYTELFYEAAQLPYGQFAL